MIFILKIIITTIWALLMLTIFFQNDTNILIKIILVTLVGTTCSLLFL